MRNARKQWNCNYVVAMRVSMFREQWPMLLLGAQAANRLCPLLEASLIAQSLPTRSFGAWYSNPPHVFKSFGDYIENVSKKYVNHNYYLEYSLNRLGWHSQFIHKMCTCYSELRPVKDWLGLKFYFFKTTGPNDKKFSRVMYMVKLNRSNVKRE